ncbi:PREDICTED: uncharacterized protein LOC104823737 [Tarenaya hassleriana]|uniref:uncharacterized protein LOC104823737 n=1 Tax=Tarenaya hassleriana TaxID=28532 RepID=UPI00053C2AC6|nr:PREDICTED: uncharacterized protein LOC104823737 [Tarenaya hassleriana]
MARKDRRLFRTLDICRQLYDFLVKLIAKQALKTVSLGHQVPRGEVGLAIGPKGGPSRDDLSSDTKCNESQIIENGRKLGSGGLEGKDLRKNVSIKDEVENIPISKRRIKRKNSTERFSSFEHEDMSPKPLRPILKQDSDLK